MNTRRDLLKCMGWAGAGIVWSVAGGIPRAINLGGTAMAATDGFSFVQISDTHIGFKGEVNPDPGGTTVNLTTVDSSNNNGNNGGGLLGGNNG